MKERTSRRVLLYGCGASMVGLAGCGEIEERVDSADDGVESDDQNGFEPSEQTDDEDSTDTDEQTGDEERNAFDEIADSDLPEYSSVQLTTADLPSGYRLVGEEEILVHEGTGNRYDEFKELGIRVFHERAFTFDAGDESSVEPDTIFSSVVIYDSVENIENGRKELQELIETEGGSYDAHSVNGADTGFVGQYETSNTNNVLVYISTGLIEIYVITSDAQAFHQEEATSLVSLLRDRIRKV